MIYLASPYTHPDATVREARYQAVCRKAASMMRDGVLVYSPLTHSCPLAKLGLPDDWAFWAEHNRYMMDACSSLLVFQLPGWRESHGVHEEVRIARTLGRPVRFEPPGCGREPS